MRDIDGALVDQPHEETRVEDLPFATHSEMVEACRKLTNNQAIDALKSRLLPLVFTLGKVHYAAAGQHGVNTGRDRKVSIVAQADPDQMLHAFQVVFGKQLLHNARFYLRDTYPNYSAAKRLTVSQVIGLVLAVIAVCIGVAFKPVLTVNIGVAVFSLIFLSVVSLRLAAILPVKKPKRFVEQKLSDNQLPVYTVLVPLFKETGVVHQLITGLNALDYPPEKLDIKLVLEVDDKAMIAALSEIPLRHHFEVIIVPKGKPQTKPKALNYALQFSRGELVVIFDAEDIPQPNQLRLSAEKFAASPKELVCLQAKLTFYNANENWLTRQFTIEYAVLFDLVLPMLASMSLPLPLGGTSNHFRMQALRRLGCWDPFNVTEDADLGIRLARFGWFADVLDSSTFEEANNDLANWMSQRARWLKGWIQTWFVHMRNPVQLWKQLGGVGFITMQVIMAGIVVSTLVHPIFLVITIWAIGSGQFLPIEQNWWVVLVSGTGLAVLLVGYGVTLFAGWLALGKRGLGQLWPSVLAMPVYWLLISVGGWLALKQFITHPFHWNKTKHGISKVIPRR